MGIHNYLPQRESEALKRQRELCDSQVREVLAALICGVKLFAPPVSIGTDYVVFDAKADRFIREADAVLDKYAHLLPQPAVQSEA